MRKLSRKWPSFFTIIAFTMPAFYIYYRIDHLEMFNILEFAQRLVGAVFVAGIAWAVYGITCFLAHKPECPSCGSKQVASYLYGISKVTRSIEQDFKAGKIVLADGIAKKDSPKWYCNDCKHEW